ncbi:hypothetical protein M0802_012183 [Mischocyttarus mexicanus]|nr:hypothetical protein M0802_012183 [Mischocyttarus mexicanus]
MYRIGLQQWVKRNSSYKTHQTLWVWIGGVKQGGVLRATIKTILKHVQSVFFSKKNSTREGFLWHRFGGFSSTLLVFRFWVNAMLGLRQGCVKVSSGFCQGFIRVLSRFYQGCVKVLSGFCQGFIRVLSGFCQGFVRVGLPSLLYSDVWIEFLGCCLKFVQFSLQECASKELIEFYEIREPTTTTITGIVMKNR